MIAQVGMWACMCVNEVCAQDASQHRRAHSTEHKLTFVHVECAVLVLDSGHALLRS